MADFDGENFLVLILKSDSINDSKIDDHVD